MQEAMRSKSMLAQDLVLLYYFECHLQCFGGCCYLLLCYGYYVSMPVLLRSDLRLIPNARVLLLLLLYYIPGTSTCELAVSKTSTVVPSKIRYSILLGKR